MKKKYDENRTLPSSLMISSRFYDGLIKLDKLEIVKYSS